MFADREEIFLFSPLAFVRCKAPLTLTKITCCPPILLYLNKELLLPHSVGAVKEYTIAVAFVYPVTAVFIKYISFLKWLPYFVKKSFAIRGAPRDFYWANTDGHLLTSHIGRY